MPCRGPSSTVSPPLGVTHQALELLTRRVDVGTVDRVRLPAPAVAVVGQPNGLAAREDGGAPRAGQPRGGGGPAALGRWATNAPPSPTSSHSTACGESSDAWKPAP